MWRALVILLALGAVARADDADATFARAFTVAPDQVKGVTRLDVRHAGFSRVLAGRYGDLGGLVLVSCDGAKCTETPRVLGPAETVEVLGVVDLSGAAMALPESRATSLPDTAMKIPVLVVKTASHADHRDRAELELVSLLDGTTVLRGSLENRTATQGGTSTHYRLEKGASKSATLELVATEQRDLDDRHSHCLQPKATQQHYRLVNGHYQAFGEPPHYKGC